MLAGLADEWMPLALIHGDVRWDNCVVFPAPHARRKTRLKLVDWELAGRGDPCWDVGSVFCDYLWCWLESIPDAGAEPSERLLDQAGYPLEAMHPAISAFWTGYTGTMGLSPPEANTQAFRATKYAAARLVQLSYEHLQRRPQITTTAIAAVQLSLNILSRPLEARAVLLGL
jgi:aminoglycoside phosphotransferase (APT) family kinase protein